MARILANDGIDEKSKSKLEKIGHTVNVEKIIKNNSMIRDYEILIAYSQIRHNLGWYVLEANSEGIQNSSW